jgi:hypothetical protein
MSRPTRATRQPGHQKYLLQQHDPTAMRSSIQMSRLPTLPFRAGAMTTTKVITFIGWAEQVPNHLAYPHSPGIGARDRGTIVKIAISPATHHDDRPGMRLIC